jgi:hypothetical protein
MAAAPAFQSSQPVLGNPATQVFLELAYHEAGKATCFFGPLAEFGPVLLHDLIEEALFGPTASIAIGTRCVDSPGSGNRGGWHVQSLRSS